MINKIKQKLSCTEYLARHGIYVKSGGRCVSPLRAGAKNPTSFFCEDKRWYDFGSGDGGDVIDLAAKLEYNNDVGEAIRGLARELGIQFEKPVNENWKTDIQNLCNRAAAYHEALTPEDFQYLASRGLSRDDIDRLMIGRVTDGYLKGRLFLPYFKNGYVCYYATRAMPGSSFQDNKYMKAALSECESYDHVPWGLHTLSKRSDLLVIAEGYFDAAAFEREGYSVISPITGNFSKDQWSDVISTCKMFPRVLIIFDNDEISHAGDGFTSRTATRLFREKIPFLVAHTPLGVKDVNDYYTSGGSLENLVKTAQDGLKYMVSQYTNAQELESFLLSINRFTENTAVSEALWTPEMQSRFAPSVLKSIEKTANTAPSENFAVNEIIKKYNILYVDNVGFYEWNGKIWQKISDTTISNYIDKYFGRFSTAQRVSAVCKLMKSRAISDVVFDRNPVFTFQNGTLEIETGVFRESRSSDYCSIIMDYDYNPDATCPRWEQFIESVTDDEPRRADVLQTLAGYILIPDCRYQKIFILLGGGSNGKSVYLEVIQALFGKQNASVVSPTGLSKEFERIKLKDSLYNIGKDVSPDFATGETREYLLQISDGTLVQACYKGQTHITFEPRCKLIYAMNKPPVASVIEGLNRRLHFIQFPCSYVDFPDPKIKTQKLKNINIVSELVEELPGIFNWAYEGYKLLNAVGYFTETPEQQDIMEQFEEISDPIAVFCADHVFSGEKTRDEIYIQYKDWCEATGHKPLSRERFIPRFRDFMSNKITEETHSRRGDRRVRVFHFL